jgi:hypothetical protein
MSLVEIGPVQIFSFSKQPRTTALHLPLSPWQQKGLQLATGI